MASISHSLYHSQTIGIIGGSQEYFVLNLFKSDDSGNKTDTPLDLSNVNDIKWLFAPKTARSSKNYAMIVKKLSDDNNDVIVLRDNNGVLSNQVQVILRASDTETLSGGFKHQIIIEDGDGSEFVPFVGIIIIEPRIQIG